MSKKLDNLLESFQKKYKVTIWIHPGLILL